jgi:hypothetical protein
MILEFRDGNIFDQNGRKIGGVVSVNNSTDFGGGSRSEMHLIFDDWIDCTGFMKQYHLPGKKIPNIGTNHKERMKRDYQEKIKNVLD